MSQVSTIPIGQPGAVVLYRDDSQHVRVSALLNNQTLWMTQRQIAELFEVQVAAISKHIQNIYDEGELGKEATLSKMEIVREEGGRIVPRTVASYSLDMVIAIGYRVNSRKATAFRAWTTNTLREYVLKGFAMDDERLKNPDSFLGEAYFDEMLERIEEIRLSERSFPQKITDIYSQCSVDYDKASSLTRRFFAQVKSKLHWTALKKSALNNRTCQADALLAKEDPDKASPSLLNRLVELCLDYAENQAKKRAPMTMADWEARLGAFLQFNEEELLADKNGKVSRTIANAFAIQECLPGRMEKRQGQLSDCDLLAAAEEAAARLEGSRLRDQAS